MASEKSDTCLGVESIKVMAESVGIPQLGDAACARMADDVMFRLRQWIQESKKFMVHGRRRKLCPRDLDDALSAQNVEPLYGFYTEDYLPFRQTSGGGRELHFHEDTEVDVQALMASSLPKVPPDVSFRAHWLAIQGVQPSIPENPPAISIHEQKAGTFYEISKQHSMLKSESTPPPAIPGLLSMENGLKRTAVDSFANSVLPLSVHDLSAEQQMYYNEITEACIGINESRRAEALNSLAQDPGLFQLVPRFSTFIFEAVKVYIIQKDMPMLRHILRMCKALLDNSSLYLEKYLHLLIPAVSSCVVTRQPCMRPEVEDQWSFRQEAARLLGLICRQFNSCTNEIQKRITRQYLQQWANPNTSLQTHYGILATFMELGPGVTRTLVLSQLKSECQILKNAMSSGNLLQKVAAENIQSLLVLHLPSVLKSVRSPPDLPETYTTDYGYLGATLCNAVVALRKTPAPVSRSGSQSGRVSGASTPTAPTAPNSLQRPRLSSSLIRTGTSPLTPTGGTLNSSSRPGSPTTPTPPPTAPR